MGRLLAFASVVGLAAAGGGWSAVSWGWAALALCWAAAIALVVRPEPLSRWELAFAGGLLALAGWMGLSTLWSQSVPSSVLEVERAVVYAAGVAAALLLFRAGAEDGVLAACVAVCAWNLVHRLAGYDPHIVGADAEPIGYANGLGLLAAIGCILALRRRSTWPALAVCLPVLWLAHSDGSWLALAAGLAVAWRPRLAPVVAVAAAIAVALAVHAPRTDYWHVAIADAKAHPALGSGAGTYRQQWIERRPTPHETRDAHSLYLETLAELGPIGLALLAATLAIPFVAGGGGLALGAYAAWVVQAGVDWEWELPAVTLAGLFCGVAALRAGPCNKVLLGNKGRIAGVAAVLGIAVFAAVGLAGNLAIARGDVSAGRRWAPWSAEPYRQAGRLRQAVAKDPHDWSLWAALRDSSTGAERRRAAAMAARLNPLGRNAPSG